MAVLPPCGTVLHSFCEAVEKWQCTYSVGQSVHSVRQWRNGSAPTLWGSLAFCEAAPTLWNSLDSHEAVQKWLCTHSVGQSCIHSMRQWRNGSAPTLWGSLWGIAFCEAAE